MTTVDKKERFIPYSLDENESIPGDDDSCLIMRRYNALMFRLNRENDQSKRDILIDQYVTNLYPIRADTEQQVKCIKVVRRLTKGIVNQKIIQAYIFATLTAIHEKAKRKVSESELKVRKAKYAAKCHPSKANVEATTRAQMCYIKAKDDVTKLFQLIHNYLYEDSKSVLEFTDEFADPPKCDNVDVYLENLTKAEQKRDALNAHYFDIIDRMQTTGGADP